MNSCRAPKLGFGEGANFKWGLLKCRTYTVCTLLSISNNCALLLPLPLLQAAHKPSDAHKPCDWQYMQSNSDEVSPAVKQPDPEALTVQHVHVPSATNCHVLTSKYNCHLWWVHQVRDLCCACCQLQVCPAGWKLGNATMEPELKSYKKHFAAV